MTTLQSDFDALRAAARAEPYPDLATRRRRLTALARLVKERQTEVVRAASDDFGHRSAHETLLSEVYMVTNTVRYIDRHLKRWMQPETRAVGMAFKPASGEVLAQPLGTVGVISPWNYPLQLALVPLAYAIAAGNRVYLKPSELTPRTSALMVSIVEQSLGPDVARVVTGGPDVAEAFSSLPFDHLFYTGSTEVGRKVMQAAARNLTPVTLELGGKSPVLVHPDYPVGRAATPIAAGKLFNAGQTCVAPDYVLVHPDQAETLASGILAHWRKLYPSVRDNPDYTSIANERHLARLRGLVADAQARGAQVSTMLPPGESLEGTRKMAPTLIRGATPVMRVMQEEIFGPILPLVEVPDHEAALRFVADRPSPLALYVFDTDGRRVDHLLRHVRAGGVAVNETMLHAADEALPFGGVGHSGTGAYHGPEGFTTFSHRKAILRQSRLNGRSFLEPPYGWAFDRLLDLLI